MSEIIGSLFGVTADQYQRNRQLEQDRRAFELAQADPDTFTNFLAQSGGRGLGNIIGRALGGEDPELQRISRRQQIMGMIDPNQPETFEMAAQAALEGGDQQLAFGLRMEGGKYAQDALQRRNVTQATERTNLAADLFSQIRNADGTLNQQVVDQLRSFPEGLSIISAQAKVLPDLRKLGATAAPEINPFAVFTDDPTIPKNVQTLAKQYAQSFASGVLDPEKSDSLIKGLAEMAQRAQQFEQNQAQITAQREQSRVLAQQGMANTQQARALAESTRRLQEKNDQDARESKAEALRNKPLPTPLAKLEDEDYAAATAATDIASDAFGYINRIKQGEIPFGRKELITIRARQVFGSSDPEVIAREDYDNFQTRLVNESLRLNKGTQTEGDSVRAAKELQSSESKEAAASAMKKLLDINVRRVQNASNDVVRRRKNAGFPDAPVPVTVPQFDVQIINNTDYNSFLKNPKFPSGTPFVDPDGVKRLKP
jgi:hypothetical protein